MIADESEMAKATPATVYLYFPDVDAAYDRAVKAGGQSIMKPTDMFYGDRSGGVKDPSGNSWFVATHIENVPRLRRSSAKRRTPSTSRRARPPDAT